MSTHAKTITQIIAETARHFGVTADQIRGRCQEIRIVQARHVAMYIARQTGVSYPRIGREFGGRHHTTVIWAVRGIASQIETDPVLARIVSALTAGPAASHYTEQELLTMRLTHLERTMQQAQKAIGIMGVAVAEIRGQLEARDAMGGQA